MFFVTPAYIHPWNFSENSPDPIHTGNFRCSTKKKMIEIIKCDFGLVTIIVMKIVKKNMKN